VFNVSVCVSSLSVIVNVCYLVAFYDCGLIIIYNLINNVGV
jgi:hypothetical protein